MRNRRRLACQRLRARPAGDRRLRSFAGLADAARQRLVFTRGSVRFHGDVMPDLDLVAETSASGVTARISVTGPATQPTFAISSNPSLPEDEILSRVLFQKSSGSLSAFQALELANAVATLSGQATRSSSYGNRSASTAWTSARARRHGPSARQRRAINDRMSVGVTTGARPRTTASTSISTSPAISGCRPASTRAGDRAPASASNGSTNSRIRGARLRRPPPRSRRRGERVK